MGGRESKCYKQFLNDARWCTRNMTYQPNLDDPCLLRYLNELRKCTES